MIFLTLALATAQIQKLIFAKGLMYFTNTLQLRQQRVIGLEADGIRYTDDTKGVSEDEEAMDRLL